MTAVGFINQVVAKFLKRKKIELGESVTVGLEARLLNATKAKRHMAKGEALSAADSENILKTLLYGDAYFQKDNGYVLYLYKVGERYMQVTVDPSVAKTGHGSFLKIPVVKNLQTINETQKKSKFNNVEKWERIK